MINIDFEMLSAFFGLLQFPMLLLPLPQIIPITCFEKRISCKVDHINI